MPKDGRGGDFSTLVNDSLPIGCPYVCGAVYFVDAPGKYRLKVVFEREQDDSSFALSSTSIMFKKKRRDPVAEQAWLGELNVDYWVKHCPQLTRPGVNVDGAGAAVDGPGAERDGAGGDSFGGADDMEDAQLITSPPSSPSSSGPSSTGEWFRFLCFLFISLKHAAFSALHPSMPTRPRVFHPRSLVNSAFRAHYFVMYSYPCSCP